MSKRNTHISKDDVPTKKIEPLVLDNEYSKKMAKEHKPGMVKQERRKTVPGKLKFADYMRIVKNGFTTVVLNIVKGKAPFGDVKSNVILWITILTIVLLIIEKVF